MNRIDRIDERNRSRITRKVYRPAQGARQKSTVDYKNVSPADDKGKEHISNRNSSGSATGALYRKAMQTKFESGHSAVSARVKRREPVES